MEKLLNLQNNLTILQQNERWNSELPEQLLSIKYILPHFKVLELGGHIGRNTMIIATLLSHHKNLVTIEPNTETFLKLKQNIEYNNLDVNIESSALSYRKLWSKNMNTFLNYINGSEEVSIINFDDLQNKYNISFDTLVVDCEGALYYILVNNPNILKNINLIIIENDFKDMGHKNYVDKVFIEYKFYKIYSEPWSGTIPPKFPTLENFYEVWKKN